MDPVSTTLVAAFVTGAANGARKVGEQAVTDSYAALKALVLAGYRNATDLIDAIGKVEEDPDSNARQQLLGEELEKSNILDDEMIVEIAQRVVQAAEKGPAKPAGLDWEDVKVAELKLGKIKTRAGAVGFRAARLEVTGKVEVGDIDVSGAPAGK